MTEFTPLSATVGGVLLGLSAGLLWLSVGRTAGISGVFGGLVPFKASDADWRIVFLVALVIGAIIGLNVAPSLFPEVVGAVPQLAIEPLAMVASGLLVGVGTRVGGGCTSGHGICGLARFSLRSVVAVAIFFGVAIVTVYVTRHVL